MYSSIDNRPLPDVPPGGGPGPEKDYEDAYILKVDSIPRRDVLPGIAIGEYCCIHTLGSDSHTHTLSLAIIVSYSLLTL